MPTFRPEIVDAVVTHMNTDHAEDSLLIVRAFAEPRADVATMVGLDSDGGLWSNQVAGHIRQVRIPWSRQISQREEIRREVVHLYRQACAKLGVEPRQ